MLGGHDGVVFSLSGERGGGFFGLVGCLGGLSEGKRKMSGTVSGFGAGLGSGSCRFEIRRFLAATSEVRDVFSSDCRSMRDNLGLAC